MMIAFSKTHIGAVTPTRSNPSDAGLDVYFSPKDGNPVEIAPNTCKLLGTGIKMEIPHGYMMQVCNRSGIASKRSLVVGAHIIDSGYSGEVMINLHNIGEKPQVVNHGDKIAQLVMLPILVPRLAEVSEEQLYIDPVTVSNRKESGFGSTGV
jgi:dUTP pyrophosphatase